MRIGIDFDNTLVNYDLAFALVGREEGLLPADMVGDKQAVKAWLMSERPDGYLWEKLQGIVYGRRIASAELYEGVGEFFGVCRQAEGVDVYIISHKTVLAHHDDANLRDCAVQWMVRHGFFESAGFGLRPENVFFEDTREDKVRRICALECDVFIDDLPDVLLHPQMPVTCRKILFRGKSQDAIELAASWNDIRHAIFGRCSVHS
jgi:hypothetical protein